MPNTITNGDDYVNRGIDRDQSRRGTGNLPVAASSDRLPDADCISSRAGSDESAISRLASTVVRVRDLRGRFADVAAMRRQLEAEQNRARVRMAKGERAMRIASEVGRDFCAARARHEVQTLQDEASETDALIGELERVARALEIERRALAKQLGECARVADALPTEGDRSRARQIIEDAMWRLDVTGRTDQTFTRGDTKQYGQAR